MGKAVLRRRKRRLALQRIQACRVERHIEAERFDQAGAQAGDELRNRHPQRLSVDQGSDALVELVVGDDIRTRELQRSFDGCRRGRRERGETSRKILVPERLQQVIGTQDRDCRERPHHDQEQRDRIAPDAVDWRDPHG